MKNVYSIAMLSLFVLAPTTFAGSKTKKVKEYAKALGRVAAGATLGTVATLVDGVIANCLSPEQWLIKGTDVNKKWGKSALIAQGVRRAGILFGMQWAREKVANVLDNKCSNENEILHGSRTASALLSALWHCMHKDGLVKKMKIAHRQYARIAQAQAKANQVNEH